MEEGYRTNLPTRVVTGDHGFDPLVVVDHPGVVVEAVKLANDGSGDVVVRLYESRGSRAEARVSLTDGAGSGGGHRPAGADRHVRRPGVR